MLDTDALHVSCETGKDPLMTATAPSPAPSPTATENLIREYVAAWESRDPDRIASYHASGGIFQLHSDDVGPVQGRDAIRDAFAAFLAQFPDLDFAEQELIAGEWGWVARWRMSGTLATAFEVGGRSAEPGARFAVDAIDLVTASRGEIDAKHTYLDWQAGLTQMGL
jgi:hypothetical protein